MDKPKVKSPQGLRYTRGLFFETTLQDKSSVVYTLKDEDHEGYPSLYRLYMDMADTTEFEFSNKYLDGHDHWKKLSETTWFKPYVERWREELRLKLEAIYRARLEQMAADGGKEALAATKTLLEINRKATERKKVGRPPTDTSQDDLTAVRASQGLIEDDYDRLMAPIPTPQKLDA